MSMNLLRKWRMGMKQIVVKRVCRCQAVKSKELPSPERDDAESEANIQEPLQKCTVGRTVIVIAHRLSTVEKADRIFVINKGKLIQVGNHQSLLEDRDGLYYSLVQRQILAASDSNSSNDS
uniref:ABC transporter domain-containing protein n=1 Tax=Acrobeloides nanus TaxID=290746 RepID=A0A914D436_9BILA